MDCSNCKKYKEITEYYKGHFQCKECVREKARKYRKEKKEKEKDVPKKSIICNRCGENTTNYRIDRLYCKECEKKHGREYRRTTTKAKDWVENNREKMSELQSNWFQKHKTEICETSKERYKTDEKFRERVNHSNALRFMIKGKIKTSKFVDCNSKRLINWVQYQFEEDMSLENHGKVWSVDHVIPCNEYLNGDYDKSVVLCWLNVKPVYITDNLKKNMYVDKGQSRIHLENVKNYIKIRKIKNKEEYEVALKEYIGN